jgi:hypothetical protein
VLGQGDGLSIDAASAQTTIYAGVEGRVPVASGDSFV